MAAMDRRIRGKGRDCLRGRGAILARSGGLARRQTGLRLGRESATMAEPVGLPVATRAWSRRLRPQPARPPQPAKRQRPDGFIAIFIGKTVSGGLTGLMPAVAYGAARIGAGRRVRREVWFYGPFATAAEIAELEKFIAKSTVKRGT